MPGDSGVTVVTMLVCSFYFACEAAGASCARHSLRPLISEDRTFQANLARIARRDRATVSGGTARIDVSVLAQRAKAEATKQSIAAFLSYLWIASLRSQ